MCGPAYYLRHQEPERCRWTIHANPILDQGIALFLLVHAQHDPIEGGMNCGRIHGQFLLFAQVGDILVKT